VRDSTWFQVPNVASRVSLVFGGPGKENGLQNSRDKKWRAREKHDWMLYSFRTTDANDVVRPVHEKAMPVILIDPDEQNEWLNGGEKSLHLQRPLADEHLEKRI